MKEYRKGLSHPGYPHLLFPKELAASQPKYFIYLPVQQGAKRLVLEF
jgi:hypothetical protein